MTERIFGPQDPKLESRLEDCPTCVPPEKLVRRIGNLAVCPNCDLQIIEVGSTVEIVIPQ